MDDDDRQRALPLHLPVTVHPDLDAGFDFYEACLGRRESDAAREEEAGHGLPMSAAQAAARHESRRFRLHSLHCLILNGYDQMVLAGSPPAEEFRRCLFSSTSARNVITSLKLLCTGSRRRSVPSATAASWRAALGVCRECEGSSAAQHGQPAPVAPVATRAGQAPVRSELRRRIRPSSKYMCSNRLTV